MITAEGVDSAEVIIRPASNGGWQVEFPGTAGVALAYAQTQCEAVFLAKHIRPDAALRFLPARESYLRGSTVLS